MPSTMRAILVTGPGEPASLQLAKIPLPELRAGEVLIRVAAAGVNGPDIAQRRGRYDPPADASPLLGLEVSGEIAAVGPGADGWTVGEPVVALCNGGGYAEFAAVPAGQVLPRPAGWSHAAAATIPETYLTTEQTLRRRAGLAPGMTVLVWGAAGGLGGTVVQVSRLAGATAIAAVSSPAKADYAMSLGAVAAIGHTVEDVAARLRDLTDGHGADRIVDVRGGDTLPLNIELAARYGHILQLSTMTGSEASLSLSKLMAKQLTLSGSTLRPQPASTKASLAASLRAFAWPAFEDGRLRPPHLQLFDLEQASDAHRRMEDRAHFGRIVLVTQFGRAQP